MPDELPSDRKNLASLTTANTRASSLRIGFVPLTDAAPLLVAQELGFFSEEGLNVTLDRQIGWGNIRDKITFGHFQIAHALLGMPVFSALGRDWFSEPLVTVMNLGGGGNAITLSKRLINSGVSNAASLGEWIKLHRREAKPAIAHVFDCSMHNYLLREWLSSGNVNPDTDVRLCVLPPPQVAGHMSKNYLEGFCVGEPWNTLAVRSGCGSIVAVTSDIVPNHPEKVLAVSTRWAQNNQPILERVIRAVLRAAAFCNDEGNTSRLTEILAKPHYLGVEAEAIYQSLTIEKSLWADSKSRAIRSPNWRLRSLAPEHTFPNPTHAAWFLSQMIRWKHLAPGADIAQLARRCVDARAYRAAAESLGVSCAPEEAPPMRLRNGMFRLEAVAPTLANTATPPVIPSTNLSDFPTTSASA